jgi:hypothetical protein
VIPAAKRARALDREHVLRFGDDAQERAVAPLVGAVRTRIVLRDRKAPRTQPDAVLERDDRIRERLRIRTRPIEQMERKARRGLRADGGQFREFVDQALNRPRRPASGCDATSTPEF